MGVLGMGDGVGCLATKKNFFFKYAYLHVPIIFEKKIFFTP